MLQNFASSTAKHKFQVLCKIGKKGPDLKLRDFLFETNVDLRLETQILAEPWWPNIPRVLMVNADLPEKLRVLKELDNYFRWKERSSRSGELISTNELMLRPGLSRRTTHTRLQRLCSGLETILPGDSDVSSLRQIQADLRAELFSKAPTQRPKVRRIPEVEQLLTQHERNSKGKKYAQESVNNHRAGLNVFFDVVQSYSLPFKINKEALDVFTEYLFEQRSIWDHRRISKTLEGNSAPPKNGWSPQTAVTRCEQLAPFIDEIGLRTEWYRFSHIFVDQAKREIKVKEHALSMNPMDMTALAAKAIALQGAAAAETSLQTRHGLNTVLGALGVLLFYPLRKEDLLSLQVGQHIKREKGSWVLDLGFTNKTGTPVDLLFLPAEATPFLDACILQGSQRSLLPQSYQARCGTPLLVSRRTDRAYQKSSFSTLFKRWVTHPPHIIRTIWCDELVARGERPETISSALQHRSILSQKAYEISAAKIRRLRSMGQQREIIQKLG